MPLNLTNIKEAPRTKETTVTTGTATLQLAGAPVGFQTFLQGIGDGNSCFYYLLDGDGVAWEMGVGEVVGATLTRTPLKSSNSNNKIVLGAGIHSVFNAPMPGYQPSFDMQGGEILNCATLSSLSAHSLSCNLSVDGIVPLLVGSVKLAAKSYTPTAKLGCTNSTYAASVLINIGPDTISTIGNVAGAVQWRTGETFILSGETDIDIYLVANSVSATAELRGLKL